MDTWSWTGSRVCKDLMELSPLLSSQFFSSGVVAVGSSDLVFIVLMEPSESVSCCCFPCMVTMVKHEVSEPESVVFWGLFPVCSVACDVVIVGLAVGLGLITSVVIVLADFCESLRLF